MKGRGSLSLSILLLLSLLPLFPTRGEMSVNEKVVRRYKRLLVQKPVEGSTLDSLCRIYIEGPGLDELIGEYEAELKREPRNPALHLILGHLYKRTGRIGEAIEEYRKAAEISPQDYYPKFALGQLNYELREYEKSIQELEEAVRLNPPKESLSKIYKLLGKAYFYRNRPQEAVKSWRRMAEVEPENAFARMELAELFKEQELYQEAIEQLQAVIRLKSDDPYRVCISLREIGEIYERMGQKEKAIKVYERAISKTAPGNWLRKDLQRRIISIYKGKGDMEGLIGYYRRKLEEAGGKEVETLRLLADAYAEWGRWDEAIGSYKKALELAPSDTQTRMALIHALKGAGKLEEAIREYDRLIEAQPNEPELYREKGALLLKLGQKEDAVRTWEEIVRRDPDDPSAHLMLAEIYRMHDLREEAIAEYERAIELSPQNVDYIEYLGDYYLKLGDREKALEIWRRMCEGQRETAENCMRLSGILQANGFKDESLVYARRAVELSPESFNYRMDLADMLVEERRYDEALKHLEAAFKMAPSDHFRDQVQDRMLEIYRDQGIAGEKIKELKGRGDAEAIKLLARLYFKLNNMTLAMRNLERYVKLVPDDISALRWLGELYGSQGELEDSAGVLKRLIELDPNNSREYYMSLAQLYAQFGRFDEAKTAASSAISAAPRNPEVYSLMAEMARRMNQSDVAVEYLKKAIRLEPSSVELHEKLASLYMDMERYRPAAEHYWRCFELSDTPKDKLRFVKSLYDAYFQLDRRDELVERLERLKGIGRDITPYLAVAEVYKLDQDVKSAFDELRRALEIQPQDIELLRQLVELSSEIGDPKSAAEYQRKLTTLEPSESNYRRLGDLLFDAGEEDEARQVWRELLKRKRRKPEADLALAKMFIRRGLDDEAYEVIRALAGRTNSPKLLYWAGSFSIGLDEPELAISCFKRLLDMDFPPPEARLKRLSELKESESIGKRYSELLKQFRPGYLYWQVRNENWTPGYFEEAQSAAMVQLFRIAADEGKVEELLNEFEEEAKRRPNDLKALLRLEQAYSIMKDDEGARGIVERMIELSPDDPLLHGALFDLAVSSRDLETALREFGYISEHHPQLRPYLSTSYIQLLSAKGLEGEVEELLSSLSEEEITDVDVATSLCSELLSRDKIDMARRVLSGIKRVSPSAYRTREIYFKVADAYSRRGDLVKAIKVYQEWLDATKPKGRIKGAAIRPLGSSYNGYHPIGLSFLKESLYYDRDRMRALQGMFNAAMRSDKLETLLEIYERKFAEKKGFGRIYPALALSYFYWWAGRKENTARVLEETLPEVGTDFSLASSLALLKAQLGDHKGAVAMLEDLASKDPMGRIGYLMAALQISAIAGDTRKAEEIVEKLLNLPLKFEDVINLTQGCRFFNLSRETILKAVMRAYALSYTSTDISRLSELGEILSQFGKIEEAKAVAIHIASLTRTSSPFSFWLQRAKVTTLGRDYIERYAKRLEEKATREPNPYRTLLALARHYRTYEQYGKEQAALERALALRPENAKVKLQLAENLERQGKTERAIEIYRSIMRESPETIRQNIWRMTRTFVRSGHIDELIRYAKESLAKPSPLRQYSLAESVANECLRQNIYKGAEELFEMLRKAQPDKSYDDQLLKVYLNTGQPDRAVQLIREKLADERFKGARWIEERTKLIAKLADIYTSQGRLDELAKEFEARLKENPDDPEANYAAIIVKLRQGEPDEANRLLKKMEAWPGYKWDVFASQLASEYMNVGAYGQAIEIYKRLAYSTSDLDRLSRYYEILGNAYEKAGDMDAARSAWEKMAVLRMMSRYWWDKKELAEFLEKRGLTDMAVEIYQQIAVTSLDRYSRLEAKKKVAQLTRKPATKPSQTEDIASLKEKLIEYGRRGERKKAREILERIVEIAPADRESKMMLLDLYMEMKDYERCIEKAKEFLKADPTDAECRKKLIEAYQRSGKRDRAISMMEEWLRKTPDPDIYEKLARAYADMGELRKAIGAYEKAAAMKPSNSWFLRRIADLYVRMDELDAAEKTLKRACEVESNKWERERLYEVLIKLYALEGKLEEMVRSHDWPKEFYSKLSDYYRKRRQFGKAIAAYEGLPEQGGFVPFGGRKENLMRCYAALGDHDAAVKIFREILMSEDPGGMSSGGGWNSTGGGMYSSEVRYGREGTYGKLFEAYEGLNLCEATSALETILEKSPDDLNWLAFMGRFYLRSRQFDKAVEVYRKLAELQPSEVRNLYWLAAAQNLAGQTEEAKATLEKARQLLRGLTSVPFNDYNNFYLYLAFACQRGKLYQTAIDLYQKLLSSPGRSLPLCLQELGKLYLTTGQYDKALEIYERIIREKHRVGGARMAWRIALKRGDLYDAVIRKQTEKLRSAPNDVYSLLFLARAYEGKEDYEGAMETLKRALEITPENDAVYAEMGRVFLKEGKLDEAKDAYVKMLKFTDDEHRRSNLIEMITSYQETGQTDAFLDLLIEFLTAEESGYKVRDLVVRLSRMYRSSGKMDVLISALETYVTEHEDDTSILKLLADLYRDRGNLERADELYAKWVASEREAFASGRKRYGKSTLARELMDRGIELETALQLCEEVAQADPLNSYNQEPVIEAYIASERYDEALKGIERYIRIFGFPPANSSIYKRLLRIAESPEDPQGFEAFCLSLIERFPEDPAMRTYAHLALSLHYRLIGDEEKAEEHREKTGLIENWHIAGPFQSIGPFGRDFLHPPEEEYLAKGEINLDSTYDGIGGEVRWHRFEGERPFGRIDLSYLNPNEWVTAYGYSTIESPAEGEALLYISGDDDIKVWLNGREILSEKWRWMADKLDMYIVPVNLRAGRNTILVKILNHERDFYFRLRLLRK
jgi:tetratricopeptide (TPR) repeat protein